MAKKYMSWTGAECLQEMGLHAVELMINSRCYRVYRHDGVVFDENYSSNTVGDGIVCRRSVYDGDASIYKNFDLFVDKDDDNFLVYYKNLMVNVCQEDGVVDFSVRKNGIIAVRNGELVIDSSCGDIATKTIKACLESNGVMTETLADIFDVAELLECDMGSQLWMVWNKGWRYDGPMLRDKEFVRTHPEAMRYLIKYHNEDVMQSLDTVCKACRIPKNLAPLLEGNYFSKIEGYHSLEEMEYQPQRIVGEFIYYVMAGKLNRYQLASYLREFPASYWDSNKIEVFLDFVRKNIWMGTNLFGNARRVFDFAKDNKWEMSSAVINSKYYYAMTNTKAMEDRLGVALTENFHVVKDSKGIVAGLRFLIENLEEEDA